MNQETMDIVYAEINRLAEQWADDKRAMAALKTLRNRLDTIVYHNGDDPIEDQWECSEGVMHNLEEDCGCFDGEDEEPSMCCGECDHSNK